MFVFGARAHVNVQSEKRAQTHYARVNVHVHQTQTQISSTPASDLDQRVHTIFVCGSFRFVSVSQYSYLCLPGLIRLFTRFDPLHGPRE